MIATIYNLIDTLNLPLLVAFLIGLLASISPCPLATNIAAIAFIGKEIDSPKKTLFRGLFYCLGKIFSYTLLATLIYFGLSTFALAQIFQGWGDKILGPILIIIGLIMLGIIKINFGKIGGEKVEQLKLWLASKGDLGAFLLGCLFALAFCPYSGVLFFGILIPLTLSSAEGLLLPPLFALGTGIPVIIFAFIVAFAMNKLSKVFSSISKLEKWLNFAVAAVFILVGIYYTQYTIKFILALLS